MHGAKANRRSFKFNLKKITKSPLGSVITVRAQENAEQLSWHTALSKNAVAQRSSDRTEAADMEPQALGATRKHSLTRPFLRLPQQTHSSPPSPGCLLRPRDLSFHPLWPQQPSQPNPPWGSTFESCRPREAAPARLTSRVLLWPLCANSLHTSGIMLCNSAGR